MPSRPRSRTLARLAGAGLLGTAVAVGTAAYLVGTGPGPRAASQPTPPAAVAVAVATVQPRPAMLWDEFSGRMEAVERVEIRSRVAGAVKAVPFAEGALVETGDLLVAIDPEPYEAEVQRLEAQLAAAQAKLALGNSDLERGQRLWDSRVVTARDLDTRVNAQREAQANAAAAQAALRAARLNLDYTQVRAPVAGRLGRREVTVGNLVPAGPGAPMLTTLVSIDPIYASFDADEAVVARALAEVAEGGQEQGLGRGRLDRIPVEMATARGAPLRGRLQLIDNHVEAASGTVRVRAVFANPNGTLMPGQFARLRLGQVKAEPALMVDERAIGTDQDKKFVLVVGADDRVAYRPVTLGASLEGLRIVTAGLTAGERIVVNGLQRVRPGALVKPEAVAMGERAGRPVMVASGEAAADR